MADARVCPVCGHKCATEWLMCGLCWAMVPGPTKALVYRAGRAWADDMGNLALMKEYRAAADAAIGSV